MLQEYVLIPLDIYKESKHNKAIENKLEAWLSFLCDDSPERILELIEKYPSFKDMYEDVYETCRNIEGVMDMFSKELLELDRNTVQYMIEEQQEQLEVLQKQVEEKQKQYEEQQKRYEEQRKHNEEQQKHNEEQQKQYEEQRKQNIEQQIQLERERVEKEALKKELNELRNMVNRINEKPELVFKSISGWAVMSACPVLFWPERDVRAGKIVFSN